MYIDVHTVTIYKLLIVRRMYRDSVHKSNTIQNIQRISIFARERERVRERERESDAYSK